MADILLLKFTQNKELGRTLLNTGGRQLLEATGDRKWAVGFDISSKGLTQKEWCGGDLLGQLLENTREAIKLSYGPISPKRLSLNNSSPSEDVSMMPISEDECQDDEEEHEGDDDVYEECLQLEDNLVNVDGKSTPSSNLDVPSLLGSPTRDESHLAVQPSPNKSHSTHKPPDSTGSPSTRGPGSSTDSLTVSASKSHVSGTRKPRNPFRSASQTNVKTRHASSTVLDQQFNISGQKSTVINQQFNSSEQHFSPLPTEKRHTRSKIKSRSQAK